MRITENIALDDAATGTQTSTVGEPSAAASRTGYVVTGNWYATFSPDRGATWQFVDPFTEFPDDRGMFCCDQLVTWAPAQRLWVWLLQYEEVSGSNIFRIAVSADGVPGSWRWWDVAPTDVDASWRNVWFDFPHMALSSSHLWISFNQYTPSDTWRRACVIRYRLTDLPDVARGTATAMARQQWATTAHGSLRFVIGAGDTMWWASNDVVARRLHVFAWPDDSATVESWAVAVSAWNDSDYTSVGPGNAPWLSRCDDRVTGGWRLAGTGAAGDRARLGWLWSSGRIAGRPHPFVRAVTLDESSLRVIGEPDLWSTAGAYAYPAAAPSRRGRVGLSACFGGGGAHPAHVVGVLDEPAGRWSTSRTAVSTHGPSEGKWGDYVTIEPHPGRPTSWVASGFTLRGGRARRNIEPRVVVFRP